MQKLKYYYGLLSIFHSINSFERNHRALLVNTESKIKELTENRSKLEDSNLQIAKESNTFSKTNAKLQDRTTKVIERLALAKQNCQGLINEEKQLRNSM